MRVGTCTLWLGIVSLSPQTLPCILFPHTRVLTKQIIPLQLFFRTHMIRAFDEYHHPSEALLLGIMFIFPFCAPYNVTDVCTHILMLHKHTCGNVHTQVHEYIHIQNIFYLAKDMSIFFTLH